MPCGSCCFAAPHSTGQGPRHLSQARVASGTRAGAFGASASDRLAASAARPVAAIGDYEAAACSTDHGVVAATIADVDEVIAAPAAPGSYQRRAGGIDERVGAGTAIQDVASRATDEDVVPGATDQGVVARRAIEDVVAGAPSEHVARRAADQYVP